MQVAGKTGGSFSNVGEIKLKNIDRPVRAWRWDSEEGALARVAADFSTALPADKPSIAVLAFTVMAADPEQEFFADGLVEDILTTLSKLSGLSVIARNSSFVYKGCAVDVRDVARELGVRYVLESSVRKSVNRIRITTRLIDAHTGVHVWAERSIAESKMSSTPLDHRLSQPYGVRDAGVISLSGCQPNPQQANPVTRLKNIDLILTALGKEHVYLVSERRASVCVT